jgi:hypothetical protein
MIQVCPEHFYQGVRADRIMTENAFVVGIAGLGAIAIGSGFLHTKIVLIVLRSFSGIRAFLFYFLYSPILTSRLV